MFNTIQMPRAGEPLRASWASNLAARVNELCTASAPGMLQREGLTGTGAAPIRTNLRRRLLAAGGDGLPRPFEAIYGGTGYLTGIGAGYYQIGGFTYEFAEFHTETLGVDEGFVCLVIDSTVPSSAHIEAFDSFDALRNLQKNLSQLIIPLYKISSGKIAMDLRNLPNGGMLEEFIPQG